MNAPDTRPGWMQRQLDLEASIERARRAAKRRERLATLRACIPFLAFGLLCFYRKLYGEVPRN